ncbi:response regulator [Streptomyces sp. KLOTTS4A1]|uniref:response regulator n=1 Tax=Streptomyces sp. KLOTTS4A1 TaxID=3390996 RepID=UPI0039F4FF99
MVIEAAEDLELVGEASNGAEAVRLAEEADPDVIVMDIRMPEMDGIEATRQIVAGTSAAQIIVLTTFDDDAYVYGALRAGAAGFLVKDMALEQILDAVRVVASGDGLLAPAVTRRLIKDFVSRSDLATGFGCASGTAAASGALLAPAKEQRSAPVRELRGITGREREVLTLIGSGLTNTEIAEKLHLSVATAKTYVTRLLAKLDARDRVRLVIMAYEAGLVGTGE